MPFAQDHYPFENKEYIDKDGFPADFISEAIDQTRGWFYTLHAIGALMGKGKAYKNVICLGHILDKDGKKMSKSLGNIVNPFDIMDKYGADAARLWMYSVNQPGDSKNFDEKTVDEVVKKVFNLASNVLSFYSMYKDDSVDFGKIKKSENILDLWIDSRLNQVIGC
jgi:isoleucyl-tRNA synthetase